MIEKIIDIVGKVFPSISARRNIIDEMQKEITRLNEKQTQYENWQKTFEIRYSQDACIRTNCIYRINSLQIVPETTTTKRKRKTTNRNKGKNNDNPKV